MDLDQTRALLVRRAQLSSLPYSDQAVAAWHHALERHDAERAMAALEDAAKVTKPALHDVLERLGPAPTPLSPAARAAAAVWEEPEIEAPPAAESIARARARLAHR